MSTTGATLIKFGGSGKIRSSFNVPVVNMDVSLITLLGIFIYGVSFLMFVVLLNKLNMSYFVPVATGVSYVLLMLASIVVFNEGFNVWKALGCILILVGVLLVVVNTSNAVSAP